MCLLRVSTIASGSLFKVCLGSFIELRGRCSGHGTLKVDKDEPLFGGLKPP